MPNDDWERAVRSADRLLKLAPDNAESLRDRGLGYLRLGYRHGARKDLDRYLHLFPDAADAGPLRERLVELSSTAVRPS